MQNTQLDEFGNLIDPISGEIIDVPTNGRALVPVKEPIASMVEGDTVPIHIRMMREFNTPSDVYSSYIGTPWVDVSKYIGKSVKIIGATVWFSGSFKPNNGDPDAPLQEGYYKVLMKTDIIELIKDVPIDRELYDIKYNVIIATSAKKVAELMYGFIQTHGWYDWQPGTVETVVFTGDKAQGYLARTIGDIKQFAVKAAK